MSPSLRAPLSAAVHVVAEWSQPELGATKTPHLQGKMVVGVAGSIPAAPTHRRPPLTAANPVFAGTKQEVCRADTPQSAAVRPLPCGRGVVAAWTKGAQK